MASDVPLTFVLLAQATHPDPVAVIAAASEMGVELAHEMGEPENLTFKIGSGGTLIVGLLPAPHPDAATMPVGPTSPDPTTVQQHEAHYIITAFGLNQDVLPPEVTMGIVTAAVIRSSPAVAAMHGHGAVFHRADVFAAMVEVNGHNIPTEITVDITAAQESEDRMSFLTHGLVRYGREEFYVTSSISGTGALDYVMGLVRWMVSDRDKVLPTGDTVGRTADEQITVQRVPSPIEGRPPVIKLDMDLEEPDPTPAKKKGWFRRG